MLKSQNPNISLSLLSASLPLWFSLLSLSVSPFILHQSSLSLSSFFITPSPSFIPVATITTLHTPRLRRRQRAPRCPRAQIRIAQSGSHASIPCFLLLHHRHLHHHAITPLVSASSRHSRRHNRAGLCHSSCHKSDPRTSPAKFFFSFVFFLCL